MKEVNLIPGEDNEDAAFDRAKIDAADVDSILMSRAISRALMPFASLLREGYGFGVVYRGGDEVSVIGVKVK